MSKAQRATEKAELEQALADHAEYAVLCAARKLIPVPLGAQWEMLREMWSLGPHVIPYISPTGSIWVRDIRHKTSRKDLPWSFANMEALRR